jgi:hypothetical protein
VRDGAGTCWDASGAPEPLRHVARLQWQGLPHIDRQRHDAFMRMPWHKSRDAQLDLLDVEPEPDLPHLPQACAPGSSATLPAPVVIASATSNADIQVRISEERDRCFRHRDRRAVFGLGRLRRSAYRESGLVR